MPFFHFIKSFIPTHVASYRVFFKSRFLSVLICLFSLNVYNGFYIASARSDTLKTVLSKDTESDSSVFVHSFIKPLYYPEVLDGMNRDYSCSDLRMERKISSRFGQFVWDWVFNDNLVRIDEGILHMTADPLLDLQYGYDAVSGKRSWLNTRGYVVQGSIGRKLFFYTDFYENQGVFIPYLDSIIRRNRVIPGQGGYKGFGTGGFDWAYASGFFSWQVTGWFNLKAGHGKHFWGDGYRSFILSDAAFNYPFAEMNFDIWSLKYSVLYAEFQDINHRNTPNGEFQKKYGTFHLLSVVPGKRWELSISESVIWQGKDSTSTRGFDINYLNPVIFFRPVEFSLGSPDNVLMGFSVRYFLSYHTKLYGQFIMDEMKVKEWIKRTGWWGNKQAYQLGFITRIPLKNPGSAKQDNLYSFARKTSPMAAWVELQSEFNLARPYTFSHHNTKQNFGHYNQSLAHPLGANFWESVSFGRIHKGRWNGEVKYTMAIYGEDEDGLNYGRNIYCSSDEGVQEYDNYTGQGLETHVSHLGGILSWTLNPATNLNLFVTIDSRTLKASNTSARSTYIGFGLRNSLRNIYTDW